MNRKPTKEQEDIIWQNVPSWVNYVTNKEDKYIISCFENEPYLHTYDNGFTAYRNKSGNCTVFIIKYEWMLDYHKGHYCFERPERYKDEKEKVK